LNVLSTISSCVLDLHVSLVHFLFHAKANVQSAIYINELSLNRHLHANLVFLFLICHPSFIVDIHIALHGEANDEVGSIGIAEFLLVSGESVFGLLSKP